MVAQMNRRCGQGRLRGSAGVGWMALAMGVAAGGTAFAAEPADGQDAGDEAASPVAEVAQAPMAPAGAAAPGQMQGPTPAADAEDDEPIKDAPVPPRVPWRGTSLRWSNAVTSSAIGVGGDFQSTNHQEYTQTFALTLNYYFVDQDKWTFRLTTTPSFTTELTDSDTNTKHEPWFDDLPLIGSFGFKLFSDPDVPVSTQMGAAAGFIFPTSPSSYNVGTYTTTTVRLSLAQEIPLAGNDSPVFKSFTLGLSGRWDHRFGAATTAVGSDFQYPRQTATGDTFLSDQLDFTGFAHDTLREAIAISFSEEFGGQSLELSPAFTFAHSFKSAFEGGDCEVVLATGCVKAATDPDARTSFNRMGFAVSLSYYPVPEAGLELGYANLAGQLGPDGARRSIFYSPAAQFTADLVLSFDAIYERIAGPGRAGAFVVRNKRRAPQYAAASPVDGGTSLSF